MPRLIVSPRPAPPCSLVLELSSCRNGSKIVCSLSAGIPGPWSATSVTMSSPSRHHRTATRSPREENLMAFDRRLTITCSTRSRTPWMLNSSAGGDVVIVTSCWFANAATVSTLDSIASPSATGSSCSSMRPASRRERSSRSFTSRMRRSPFRRAISSSSRAEGSSAPPAPARSSDREAFTDVIGVRSSWLTTDTNSDLRRSASTSWVTSRYRTMWPSSGPPPPPCRTGATTRCHTRRSGNVSSTRSRSGTSSVSACSWAARNRWMPSTPAPSTASRGMPTSLAISAFA